MSDDEQQRLLDPEELRSLVDDAYGSAIPVEDYPALIVVLHQLGASWRRIVKLVEDRSVRRPGQVINDVLGLVGDVDFADDAAISRVRTLLQHHASRALPDPPPVSPSSIEARAAQGERSSPSYDAIPADQFGSDIPLPAHLLPVWSSLERAFPEGVDDLRDYIAILEVLASKSLPRHEIWLLVTRLIDRPKDLVMADLENLGTVLIAPEKFKRKLEAIVDDD